MRRISVTAVTLVVMGLWGACARARETRGQVPASTSPAVSAYRSAAGMAGEAREIRVTARKYEFTPNPIRVKKGEQVRLLITAVDHDHGFKIDEFNINQLIKKGTTATIDLTPEKTGTFHFRCSHFCGMGHPKMHGELIVEEQ